MKKYSSVYIPVLSFFSKSLYRDVSVNRKGTLLGYLLLLLAVCWIPGMIRMQDAISDFVDQKAPKIVSQMPGIVISDGEASIDEQQPYYIKNPDTGAPLVVIDTTGQIRSLKETDAFALITKTEAITRQNKLETRRYSFSDIDELHLDRKDLSGWLTKLKKFAVPLGYPFAVLASYVLRIIQVLIYAAIGLAFAAICKSERSYKELFRLAVTSVTPVIIIKTILWASAIRIPFSGVIYFLIGMGYLFYGVKVSAGDKVPPDESVMLDV